MSDDDAKSDDSYGSDATVYTKMHPGEHLSQHFELFEAYADLPYHSAASFSDYENDKSAKRANWILVELKLKHSDAQEATPEMEEAAKKEMNKIILEELKLKRSDSGKSDFQKQMVKEGAPVLGMDDRTKREMKKLVQSRRWRKDGYHPGFVMEPRSVDRMSTVWQQPQYENWMNRLRLEEAMFATLHKEMTAMESVTRSRSFTMPSKPRILRSKSIEKFSLQKEPLWQCFTCS